MCQKYRMDTSAGHGYWLRLSAVNSTVFCETCPPRFPSSQMRLRIASYVLIKAGVKAEGRPIKPRGSKYTTADVGHNQPDYVWITVMIYSVLILSTVAIRVSQRKLLALCNLAHIVCDIDISVSRCLRPRGHPVESLTCLLGAWCRLRTIAVARGYSVSTVELNTLHLCTSKCISDVVLERVSN